MPKVLKKPVWVEAVQWGGDIDAIKPLLDGSRTPHVDHEYDLLLIPSGEGMMAARPGDWVIRGEDGYLRVCKPDIFAATYEPLES